MLPRNPTHRVRTASCWLRCSTQVSESFSFCFFDGDAVGSIRLAPFPCVFGSPVAPTPGQARVSAHLAFHQTRKCLQPNAHIIPSQPLKATFHTLCFYRYALHLHESFLLHAFDTSKGRWQRNTPHLYADNIPLITRHHYHTHCLNPFASKGERNKQSLSILLTFSAT